MTRPSSGAWYQELARQQNEGGPDFVRSLIAERKEAVTTLVAGNIVMPAQTVSLINWQATPETARSLRVTLLPLRRFDSIPAFPGVAAGTVAPIVPGNPAGWQRVATAVAENIIIEPLRGMFGHITWGIGAANPSEIVCDWPVQGASFDVIASRLTVDVVMPAAAPVPPGLAGAVPTFAAEACKADPVNRPFEQLSFSQSVTGLNAAGPTVAVAVPWYAQSLHIGLQEQAGTTTDQNARLLLVWRHVNGNNVGGGGTTGVETLPLTIATSGAIEISHDPYTLPVPHAAGILELTLITADAAADWDVFLEWRLSL